MGHRRCREEKQRGSRGVGVSGMSRAGRPEGAQPRGAALCCRDMGAGAREPAQPVTRGRFGHFAEPWLCRFVTLLFAPLIIARFG